MPTPGQRRFGRRALLAGTACAAGALVAYEAPRLVEDGSAAPPTTAPGSAAQTGHVVETGQTVDLSVRWRHLERRVRDRTLLAGWQFDEGSGYAFQDVSGHGHSLHITGLDWNTTDSGLASSVHRRGLRGGAVFVDESRWLAAAPSAVMVPRTGLTIACWVRLDRLPESGAVLVAFGVSYTLTLSDTGVVTLRVSDRLGGERVVHTPLVAVTPGRWTHIAATVAPRTGVLRLYVDGDPVARTETKSFALLSRIASLVVGGRLRGRFDEVTIHQLPLGAAEVRRLYVVGLPKVYTQTAESIDGDRSVFTRYRGSDPIPHPVETSTVLTHRFAGSTQTDAGDVPLGTSATAVFVPGVFGGAWQATDQALRFPSPVAGDAGTFEAWFRTIDDPGDPTRQRRKELFGAHGPGSRLILFSAGGRWQVQVRRSRGRDDTVVGPDHPFLAGNLEHVAVAWGRQPDGAHGVALHVNGVPSGFVATAAGETSYPSSIRIGGTRDAPAYALVEDVRISDVALSWGQICPRGHASTDAAGLDLRDRFDRPAGSAPLLWRPGSAGGGWSHRTKSWERPDAVGADPESARALFQGAPLGRRTVVHPDAFGHASSIEVGVSFPETVDGWAGVFVQASEPPAELSGLTFMLNPARGRMRLAELAAGLVITEKVLPHDFAIRPRATYELTLTNAGDGVVRGFVDGSNVISMRLGAHPPDRGYAGMVTEDAKAFFSDLHFCALTPATATSRIVRTRVIRSGDDAAVESLGLVPFRWHKRRGLLPWQYTLKDPEPAGNIAGADTELPPRPLAPAAWRSEDSANSDLVTVDGRVCYFMRGNPRVGNKPSVARIGVLQVGLPNFDGLHFSDPNRESGRLTGGTILASSGPLGTHLPVAAGSRQLNEPSTAYVGNGRLLFFGRESTVPGSDEVRTGRLAYSRYDVRSDSWEHDTPQHLPWSLPGPLATATEAPFRQRLRGTPEVVSLRSPDDDAYQAVVFQQTGPPDDCVMVTAMLDQVSEGVPALSPGVALQRSLSRSAGGAIYGFRVMFDNGIYYLHYNDGSQVPDWPDRFVLAATLDPYAGPWVENAETTLPESTYFRRGDPFDPDNGAIWQGTMVKLRGRYYLYYENFHAIDDVDQPYQSYANQQTGSRVGFATA